MGTRKIMISSATVRKLALSLAGVDEQPHFEKASFRIKKKIFATLSEKENRAMLKLSLIDQSVFCAFDTMVFYPVPGSWGAKGATFVDLAKVKMPMFRDALQCAYELLNKGGKEY